MHPLRRRDRCRHPTTHEPEFCSDACENGEVEALSCYIESPKLMRFLNRLRILRSLDAFEVPLLAGNWLEWRKFRDGPVRVPHQLPAR